MTITSTQNRVSYAGNGAPGVPGTLAFAVPFRFLATGDLVVLVRVDATGVDTTKTLDTHYSVAGEGAATGGTVTFLIEDGEPQTGETLIIYGNPAMTQLVDYIAGGVFPAESHEEALDRLTLQSTRTREIAERALPLTDSSTDGSGEYNANNNDIDAVGTLTASKVAGLAAPTGTTDATNKNYVDATVNNTIGPIPDGDTYVTATGSTTLRKISDRAGEIFNVKDFGAVGDGVTDDTAALLAAIAGALVGGRRHNLYFPNGTYLTSQKLTLDPTIKYDFGPYVTIKATATMDYVMGTEAAGAGSETFQINNGPWLDANNLATHAAYFYKLQFSRIQSIAGIVATNSVAAGIHFFSCQGGIVGGMKARFCGGDGFWFTSCNSMKVYGAKSNNNGGVGYKVRGKKAAVVTNVTQAGSAVVTSAGHGFPNGESVAFAGVVGMTQLNGNSYVVSAITTNTFELSSLDSSGFGAYVSGGTATGGVSGGMSLFGINSEVNTGHGFVCDHTLSPVFVYGAWLEGNVGDGFRAENSLGGGVYQGSITGPGSGTNSMINLTAGSLGFDIDASVALSSGNVNWYTPIDLGSNNTIRTRLGSNGTAQHRRKEELDSLTVVDGDLLMQRGAATAVNLGGTGGILNGGLDVACEAATGADTFFVDIVTGKANAVVAAEIDLVGQFGNRGHGVFKQIIAYAGIVNGTVDGDPSITEVVSLGDAAKKLLINAATPVTIDGATNGFRVVFTNTWSVAFTGMIRVIVHSDLGRYVSTTVTNNQ